MEVRFVIVMLAPLALAGCGSITLPAAVKLETGEALVGTTTAAMSGGTFQVSTPSGGLTCSGTYDAFDTSTVIVVPFRCTDGRMGSARVIRSPDGQYGAGTLLMATGEKGTVGFGRSFGTALSGEFPAAPSYGTSLGSRSVSSGWGSSGNCPTPDSIAADGKRCGARAAGYQNQGESRSSRPWGYRRYYTGPRGGCYYLTSGGNKRYVDRSMCR